MSLDWIVDHPTKLIYGEGEFCRVLETNDCKHTDPISILKLGGNSLFGSQITKYYTLPTEPQDDASSSGSIFSESFSDRSNIPSKNGAQWTSEGYRELSCLVKVSPINDGNGSLPVSQEKTFANLSGESACRNRNEHRHCVLPVQMMSDRQTLVDSVNQFNTGIAANQIAVQEEIYGAAFQLLDLCIKKYV
jgi:hypothetical protein